MLNDVCLNPHLVIVLTQPASSIPVPQSSHSTPFSASLIYIYATMSNIEKLKSRRRRK